MTPSQKSRKVAWRVAGLNVFTMNQLRLLGILAALGSAASWAIGSILLKNVGQNLSSLAMTLVKGVVSLVLLAAALAIVGGPWLGGSWWDASVLVLSGVLGIALGDTLFFEALKDLSPVALIVLGMVGQVLSVFLAVLFLGETPKVADWIGIALVFSGIGLVLRSNLPGGGRGGSRLRGVAYGLAAAACMSVSWVIIKPLLATVSPSQIMQVTFVRMLVGTAGMLLFGLATQRIGNWIQPFRQPRVAGRFLGAVCVVTFGGFYLSTAALKYLDMSVAAVLTQTEPLFVLPLAAVLYREKIAWTAAVGVAAVLAGLVFLGVPQMDTFIRHELGFSSLTAGGVLANR